MPKIIVTSRYLKSSSKRNLTNYVKYIATREGSVAVTQKDENAPATSKQQELISSLLNDFPDAKNLFEYEDFEKNQTVKNASNLISKILDRNMDRLTNRKNYVGYLANRPGAVKFGRHGLFSQTDEEINLDKVAKEIADHKGNVWTHVVSLRRDNAQAMGYDNLNAWHDLIKRQIPNIAKNQKIDLKNLRWYAAFHDKKTNPHVHIIIYSENPKEGFLTNHGIEKIRSGFANDIYADELHNLYSQQTDLRNLLKKESETLMKSLAEEVRYTDINDNELCGLIFKLKQQLKDSKGKKVYGYLKPKVKKTVDDIFEKLSQNKSIEKMYSLWCEMQQQKHDIYSSARVDFPSLTDNKEFKSAKNMIIQIVLEMNDLLENIEMQESVPDEISEETEVPYDENIPLEENSSTKQNLYIKWSDDYKSACKLIYDKNSKFDDFKNAEKLLLQESESGNILAIYDLGKLYSTEKLGEKDKEKSFDFYQKALQGFLQIEPMSQKLKPYIQYRIGKIFCYGLSTEQDYTRSFRWFKKSAEQENKFAQFSLANQFYFGNGTEKNLEKAFEWYKKSAEQGLPYAAYSVAQMYSKGEFVEQSDELAKKYYSKALSGFLEFERKDQADDNLFYKIGIMYEKGLGTEINIQKAVEYFQRSADNKWSSYQLGKLYLFGNDDFEKDKGKAVEWLTKSSDSGNEYAQNLLDNIDDFESQMLKNTVLSLFVNLSRCIEDDYSQKYSQGRKMVDSKLRRVIMRKKQSLGVKNEQSQGQEQGY